MCITTKGNSVAKNNIHMDHIKELMSFLACLTRRWVIDCSKLSNAIGKFASIDEFCILGGSNDVTLIFKFPAAVDFVELKWFKGGTRLAWGWCVLRSNWWELGDIIVK